VEGVPRSGDVKVKEIQKVNKMVMVSAGVHRDACLVQPGAEEDYSDQVAISTVNGSIVEAVGVAEGVLTSVRINHGSYSTSQAWCQTIVQPDGCRAQRLRGVLTWYRSLVLLNLSVAESFAFRA